MRERSPPASSWHAYLRSALFVSVCASLLSGSLQPAHAQASPKIVAGSCLAKAHAREPPSEYLDLFKRQSRALPNMSRTDLGDSDWQGPVWWPDNDSPRRSDGSWPLSEASRLKGPPMNSCYTNYGVLKFKIWKGELYAYGTSFTRAAHWTNRMYRNYLVEQLLAVMWLYKDFPDELDIFYCWWDTPCLCDLKVPFIQYGMFGNDTMRYHAPSHRRLLSSTSELLPAAVQRQQTHQEQLAATQHNGRHVAAIVDAASSRAVPQPAGQELVAPSTSQPREVYTRRALLEALPSDADVSPLLDINVLRSSFLMFEDGSHKFSRKTMTSRGWLWPYPDTWRELSLSPDQLRHYSDCLVVRARNATRSSRQLASEGTDETAPYSSDADGGTDRAEFDNSGTDANSSDVTIEPDSETDLQPWPRIPRLVWRGRATGYVRGWSPIVAHDHQWRHATKLGSLLLNKRLYMSLLARPYPWMDVGITGLVPDPMSGFKARGSTSGSQTDQQIMAVVGRSNVTMEAWTQYDLTLSIDGFGPPWRLPRQLLGMTPIVKVESPFQEWFAKRLQPGVHYEPVEYDLSNLASRSKQLMAEAHSGSDRLHRMALAAREMAVNDFHAMMQMDMMAWSLLNVKAASPWKVASPHWSASNPPPVHLRWNKVTLGRDHQWGNAMLAKVKEDIMDFHQATFGPKDE
ncbi:hypothetical protein QJQ45_004136 [Haematococcus lacustris]|nr:hypothetical protein QJQ45_004136 [Haematococcus lacustris]